MAGAGDDTDCLDPAAVLDALFGSPEGRRDFEQRLLSTRYTPAVDLRPPVEPWLLDRVRALAERGFGSPASAADAVSRVRRLLEELDTPDTA